MKLAVESYLYYLLIAFLSLFCLDVAGVYAQFHQLHMCRDAIAYALEVTDGDIVQTKDRLIQETSCQGIQYKIEKRSPSYWIALSMPVKIHTLSFEEKLHFRSLVHVKK